MAENVTIARPYAEAVFRLARDAKALTAWSELLKALSLAAQNPDMAEVFSNPSLSSEQRVQVTLAVVGEEKNAEFANFVRALAENERLAVLPQIYELYEQLKSTEEGVKEAVIHSAFPLDDAQLKQLVVHLESHFKSKLTARVDVDPELIGGIKVVVGDEVLDASVRGKLDVMATALKS